MRPRAIATLLVVATLVLAGCSGPTDPDETTTTGKTKPAGTSPASPTRTEATSGTTSPTVTTSPPTSTEPSPPRGTATPPPENRVRVVGVNLRTNASRIYRTIETLLGEDVGVDVTLHVRETIGRNDTLLPFEASGLRGIFGVERQQRITNPAGALATTGEIFLYLGNGSDRELNATLAHEFTHIVQYASGANQRLWANLPASGNEAVVREMMIEGVAEYSSYVYLREVEGLRPSSAAEVAYGGSATVADFSGPNGTVEPPDWNDLTVYEAWVTSDYYFGTKYVTARIDSPSNAETIYRNPPTTVEQVLHGMAPGSEPPAPLSVTADADGGWTFNASASGRTMGERFVWVSLLGQLDHETAWTAATGWGNDTVLRFDRGDDRGFAWVLRWDDASNATEYLDAVRTYLERRTGRTENGVYYDEGTAFRLASVGNETIVLFAGAPDFVENASATGSSGAVTVAVEANGTATETASNSQTRISRSTASTSARALASEPICHRAVRRIDALAAKRL